MSELQNQKTDLTVKPAEPVAEPLPSKKEETKMTVKHILCVIFYLICSSYAAYLSLSCSQDSHMIMRSIYALFAFSGGIFYLIAYSIFKQGLCKSVKVVKAVNAVKLV